MSTTNGVGPLIFAAFLVMESSAEDWPAWRGPRGDGTSLEQDIPTQWSATENIAWKTEIPGSGHASPIVFGDRVYLVTCVEDVEERQLLCLNRKTGEIVWTKTVIEAPLEAIHKLNSRASSTPATDGSAIYVSFLEPDGSSVPAEIVRERSGDLRANNAGLPVNPGKMCYAAFDMDGNRKWIARPGEFASVWGYCASPIVHEDKVIVNGDHDGDAFIAALNKETGETIWKVARENRIRSHCVPLIREIDGRTQLMITGSHSIVSYNPADGSKHWFTVGPKGRAVASPVFANGFLLVATAYPDREFLALRPDGHGDVTETHIVWRDTKSAPYVPSPIAVGDYFLAVHDSGIASCFNVTTGELYWRERIGKGHTAALVSAGGLVYFLSDRGIMRVVRPGEEYEIVAESAIGEPCYASPAISRGQIFLRTEKHLICIGEESSLLK